MEAVNITEKQQLIVITEVPIRFSEVDAMSVVWHGNYLKYFEEGREAFGSKYDLRYLDVFGHGYLTPIVKTVCEHKKPIEYGDTAIVKTTYMPTPAAKIIFQFGIYRKSDNELAATGESIQVFLNNDRELQLIVPPFFDEWKRKHLS